MNAINEILDLVEQGTNLDIYEGDLCELVRLAKLEINQKKEPQMPYITNVPEDYIFSEYPVVEIHCKHSQRDMAEELRKCVWDKLRAFSSPF